MRSLRTVAHGHGDFTKGATVKREIICGIYRFIYKDGRSYVGSGKDVFERRKRHIQKSRDGDRNYFRRSMRELGPENFTFEIIEVCDPEIRLERESFHISKFNSVYPNGFNTVKDPARGWDYIMTESARSRISKAMIGNKHLLGKKFSPESCAQMSKSHTGMIMPPETRAKISIAKSGKNHHFYGKKLKPEHVAKIAAGNMGKKMSWSAKKALSSRMRGAGNHFYGKHLEKAHREKISKANLGRKFPPSFGRKISAALKGVKKTEKAIQAITCAQRLRRLKEAELKFKSQPSLFKQPNELETVF